MQYMRIKLFFSFCFLNKNSYGVTEVITPYVTKYQQDQDKLTQLFKENPNHHLLGLLTNKGKGSKTLSRTLYTCGQENVYEKALMTKELCPLAAFIRIAYSYNKKTMNSSGLIPVDNFFEIMIAYFSLMVTIIEEIQNNQEEQLVDNINLQEDIRKIIPLMCFMYEFNKDSKATYTPTEKTTKLLQLERLILSKFKSSNIPPINDENIKNTEVLFYNNRYGVKEFLAGDFIEVIKKIIERDDVVNNEDIVDLIRAFIAFTKKKSNMQVGQMQFALLIIRRCVYLFSNEKPCLSEENIYSEILKISSVDKEEITTQINDIVTNSFNRDDKMINKYKDIFSSLIYQINMFGKKYINDNSIVEEIRGYSLDKIIRLNQGEKTFENTLRNKDSMTEKDKEINFALQGSIINNMMFIRGIKEEIGQEKISSIDLTSFLEKAIIEEKQEEERRDKCLKTIAKNAEIQNNLLKTSEILKEDVESLENKKDFNKDDVEEVKDILKCCKETFKNNEVLSRNIPNKYSEEFAEKINEIKEMNSKVKKTIQELETKLFTLEVDITLALEKEKIKKQTEYELKLAAEKIREEQQRALEIQKKYLAQEEANRIANENLKKEKEIIAKQKADLAKAKLEQEEIERIAREKALQQEREVEELRLKRIALEIRKEKELLEIETRKQKEQLEIATKKQQEIEKKVREDALIAIEREKQQALIEIEEKRKKLLEIEENRKQEIERKTREQEAIEMEKKLQEQMDRKKKHQIKVEEENLRIKLNEKENQMKLTARKVEREQIQLSTQLSKRQQQLANEERMLKAREEAIRNKKLQLQLEKNQEEIKLKEIPKENIEAAAPPLVFPQIPPVEAAIIPVKDSPIEEVTNGSASNKTLLGAGAAGAVGIGAFLTLMYKGTEAAISENNDSNNDSE
jgi:hypothetical protein